MIADYLLRLLIVVPMVGGLAWGSLWLWKRVQAGLPIKPQRDRPAELIDQLSLGASGKLLVVRFGSDSLLLGVSRGGINHLATLQRDTDHA